MNKHLKDLEMCARRGGKTVSTALLWVDTWKKYPLFKWYKNPIKYYKWKKELSRLEKAIKEI